MSHCDTVNNTCYVRQQTDGGSLYDVALHALFLRHSVIVMLQGVGSEPIYIYNYVSLC